MPPSDAGPHQASAFLDRNLYGSQGSHLLAGAIAAGHLILGSVFAGLVVSNRRDAACNFIRAFCIFSKRTLS